MAKTLIILMFPWQYIPLAKDILKSCAVTVIFVVETQQAQEFAVSSTLSTPIKHFNSINFYNLRDHPHMKSLLRREEAKIVKSSYVK